MSASLWLWRHVTSSPGFTPARSVRNDPILRARHSRPCQNIVRMLKLRALRQGKHFVDDVEAVRFARFHLSSLFTAFSTLVRSSRSPIACSGNAGIQQSFVTLTD
eukprot:828491-Prorocentrum_minimum.AAC.2